MFSNRAAQLMIGLALLGGGCGEARAETQFLPLESGEVYQMTLVACRGISGYEIASSDAKKDRYRRGDTASPRFNDYLQLIQDDSRSAAWEFRQYRDPTTATVWLMVQPSFRRAVEECYGRDFAAAEWFRGVVLRADKRGKALAGAKVAALLWGGGRVLQMIARAVGVSDRAVILASGAAGLLNHALTALQTRRMRAAVATACQRRALNCPDYELGGFLTIAADQGRENEHSDLQGDVGAFFTTVIESEISELQKSVAGGGSSAEAARTLLAEKIAVRDRLLRMSGRDASP